MASQRWQPGLLAKATFVARKHAIVITAVFCFLLLVFFGLHINDGTPRAIPQDVGHGKGDGKFNGTWDSRRDSRNLMLTDEQCTVAFPELYHEIDRMVARRKNNRITRKEMDDNENNEYHKIGGHAKGYIHDHNIYLTNITRGYFTRVIGVLQSVHRAVLTSPEPIPNIEFTLFSVDKVHNVTGWALTRASDDVETWLMPDFGYFSWPENKISSYNHVQRRAREMEEGSPHSGPEQKAYPWKDKTPKLVWRGSEGPKGAPRRALVSAAKDQPWGDALPIHWDPKQGHVNVISMADHCRWKYVAHTEGVSYSGRLKYLQNCRSVVVSHRLTWRTHAMHLMRSTPGPQQNFVEVQPDYTDLDEKMAWLLADDKRAERIADNSARVFRDRYLSPAAEVCYWRKLFRAWASVSEEAWPWVERNGTTEYKGVPVEDYFLMHKLDWEQH